MSDNEYRIANRIKFQSSANTFSQKVFITVGEITS